MQNKKLISTTHYHPHHSSPPPLPQASPTTTNHFYKPITITYSPPLLQEKKKKSLSTCSKHKQQTTIPLAKTTTSKHQTYKTTIPFLKPNPIPKINHKQPNKQGELDLSEIRWISMEACCLASGVNGGEVSYQQVVSGIGIGGEASCWASDEGKAGGWRDHYGGL